MKETKDILVTFENLNNHEVFTPPRIARDMLDLLPKEIWSDPNIKLLDPAVKTGVFLRESFYRLFEGLDNKGIYKAHDGQEYNLDNQQERINHILKNMLYGIATSELTGYISRRTLYGVMEADSDKVDNALLSVMKVKDVDNWGEYKQGKFVDNMIVNDYFDFTIFSSDKNYEDFEKEGNIFYPTNEVQKRVIEENNYELEDTYYPFIEENIKHKKIKEIQECKMKFDVIIGNPPYNKSTNGSKSHAKPIYHLFVENSIKLKPTYISMIIPSKWMQGGIGVDKFKDKILSDTRMKIIVDFKNANDCFIGIEQPGGVNYFLWDNNHNGECLYSLNENDSVGNLIELSKKKRKLDRHKTFIRDNYAEEIVEKILKIESNFMNEKVISAPWGLPTYFKEYEEKYFKNSIKIYGNKERLMLKTKGIGYIKPEQLKNLNFIDSHKVFIPESIRELKDKAFYGEPGSVCTQTYMVLGIFETKQECENLIKFLNFNLVSFLLKQLKVNHHTGIKIYSLIPILDMKKKWTEIEFDKRYGINKDEREYIRKSIKLMAKFL